MAETAPWWGSLLLPGVLVVLGVAAVAWRRLLLARAGGVGDVTAPLTAPLREAGWLLVQQQRRTLAADGLLQRCGASALVVAAVLVAAVIPLGDWVVSDTGVGVVWFNAMEVVAWAAVWLVGWGTNSFYGLVGGYRFVAQGLAYELPHMFALITAALGAGSLSVVDVASAQRGLWFVVWMPVAFAIYLVSAVGMAFAAPFDHPVAADIAGGAATELSGVDRLIFAAGRWLLLVSAVAMAVPLFLGGGAGPLLPAWLWTVVKTVGLLALVVWAGTKLPTIRMERYEEVAWIVLIPLALLQALVVAVVVLVR